MRWLQLLATSAFPQAVALIRSDTRYLDLSITQYASALDWLARVELVEAGSSGWQLSEIAFGLPSDQLSQLLFARSLDVGAPAWLPDADVLIRDAEDIPQDASALAASLGLTDEQALLTVRQVHGRIDLELRARIGAAGEQDLIRELEERWPRSTTHVAAEHDGFGYDIGFTLFDVNWHLEVKTTIRRGRLAVHLSRHEYEVGRSDPKWRLVIAGLDEKERLSCVATARLDQLWPQSPQDVLGGARWQSARFELTQHGVCAGLSFLGEPETDGDARSLLFRGSDGPQPSFAWMPTGGVPSPTGFTSEITSP